VGSVAPRGRPTPGEFVDPVAVRAGVDGPKAAFVARAVCEVVDEATRGAVMTKVREAQPDDLRQLVSAGSSGERSG
jgi:uncharacterized protein (DUF2267 family)